MATESHAIVFGAAGLLGWATVDQLLSSYPSSNAFSRVTAVLNRPVSESDLCLPSEPNQPALEIISGVNLLQATGNDLAEQLKVKVAVAEGITHAFYFGRYRLAAVSRRKRTNLDQSSRRVMTTTSKSVARTAASCSEWPTR